MYLRLVDADSATHIYVYLEITAVFFLKVKSNRTITVRVTIKV